MLVSFASLVSGDVVSLSNFSAMVTSVVNAKPSMSGTPMLCVAYTVLSSTVTYAPVGHASDITISGNGMVEVLTNSTDQYLTIEA
jgi:hypothetical protein